jgi:hypothetical protein
MYVIAAKLTSLQGPGCSGSWVAHGESLIGMIIAAYDNEPYAHFIPSDVLLRDVRAAIPGSTGVTPTNCPPSNVDLSVAPLLRSRGVSGQHQAGHVETAKSLNDIVVEERQRMLWPRTPLKLTTAHRKQVEAQLAKVWPITEKVGKALCTWYSGTNDTTRARQFVRFKLHLSRECDAPLHPSSLKDYPCITVRDLCNGLNLLASITKDLAASFPSFLKSNNTGRYCALKDNTLTRFPRATGADAADMAHSRPSEPPNDRKREGTLRELPPKKRVRHELSPFHQALEPHLVSVRERPSSRPPGQHTSQHSPAQTGPKITKSTNPVNTGPATRKMARGVEAPSLFWDPHQGVWVSGPPNFPSRSHGADFVGMEDSLLFPCSSSLSYPSSSNSPQSWTVRSSSSSPFATMSNASSATPPSNPFDVFDVPLTIPSARAVTSSSRMLSTPSSYGPDLIDNGLEYSTSSSSEPNSDFSEATYFEIDLNWHQLGNSDVLLEMSGFDMAKAIPLPLVASDLAPDIDFMGSDYCLVPGVSWN